MPTMQHQLIVMFLADAIRQFAAKRIACTTRSGMSKPQARIPEYWIVDPGAGTITVLAPKPRRKTYTKLCAFPRGTRARSELLDGFTVGVTEATSQAP
jgi:Uma2 family endonuclease